MPNRHKMVFTSVSALLISVMLFMSGCGFHLRGVGNVGAIDIKSIQIVAPAGVRVEVRQALESLIKQSGIVLVDSMAKAEVQVKLQPTVYRATRTALSGLGDTTAEYLTMKQAFKAVQVATGQVLVSSTAETARDRQILNSALLASQRELQGIQRDMAQNIAQQILVSLQRASTVEVAEMTDADKLDLAPTVLAPQAAP